jgi:hypothetical protein
VLFFSFLFSSAKIRYGNTKILKRKKVGQKEKVSDIIVWKGKKVTTVNFQNSLISVHFWLFFLFFLLLLPIRKHKGKDNNNKRNCYYPWDREEQDGPSDWLSVLSNSARIA